MAFFDECKFLLFDSVILNCHKPFLYHASMKICVFYSIRWSIIVIKIFSVHHFCWQMLSQILISDLMDFSNLTLQITKFLFINLIHSRRIAIRMCFGFWICLQVLCGKYPTFRCLKGNIDNQSKNEDSCVSLLCQRNVMVSFHSEATKIERNASRKLFPVKQMFEKGIYEQSQNKWGGFI